jgi:hypothetical protein
MRLLILSEPINRIQRFSDNHYVPPYDLHLDVGDLNDADAC